MIGRTLSHFEITARLGAGGMGEVYRARDTRLGREVALKVLPERLQSDEGFRRRFGREAEAISQLQHPDICALYDIGSEDGIDFLVMELLEGETLEARLGRERLPVREALALAARIAGALERAHRAGIVHRDLKPGNIMLTADGPKVLDFGLAKGFFGGRSPAADTGSPTELISGEGSIVGTIHYMAPEQLHGKPVDARTDIFALGCVLHEMLTGARPFDGESPASLIAAILEHEPPPLGEIGPDSPAGLARVVERCLAKDPESRWQSSADVQALLEDLAADRLIPTQPLPTVVALPTRPRTRGLLAASAILLALAGAAGGWLVGRGRAPRTERAAPTVARHVIGHQGLEDLTEVSNPTLSADGSTLAFIGTTETGSRIYLRRLDELEARAVEGTLNAAWTSFSPDGQWLLYFDVVDRKLMKVSVHGGTAQEVADPGYIPARWENDGYIYYTQDRTAGSGTPDGKGLWRVAAAGSEPPEQLTRAQPRPGTTRHLGHYAPQLLPGGRKLLFSVGDGYLPSDWQAAVLDLDSGEWEIVFEEANQVVFVDGHLVFWRDGRLWATSFDPNEPTAPTSAPRPVVDAVGRHPLAPIAVGQYHVSANGDLIYLDLTQDAVRHGSLVARRFDGREVPLAEAASQRFYSPSLSADGQRLAVERCTRYDEAAPVECRFWVMNLGDGSSSAATSAGPGFTAAIWETSGQALIYGKVGDGGSEGGLRRQPLDGSPPTPLLADPDREGLAPVAALRDGRVIFVAGPIRLSEIRMLLPDGSVRVLKTAAEQTATDVSLDERWLIFHSDESGQSQLYALDLQAENARPVQLTTAGAQFARLSPDGRYLYARSRTYPGPAEIQRFSFDPETARLGDPVTVLRTAANAYTSSWWILGWFEVTDEEIILPRVSTPPRSGRMILVRNWLAEVSETLR